MALRFTLLCLCVCLFGSRLGIVMGSSRVSLVGFLVLALAAWAFARGIVCLDRVRAGLFCLLAALTMASMAVAMIMPDRFGAGQSWTSALQFLLLSSLATLRFDRPVDETRFFKGVNGVFAIIALAGVAQFFTQFAGLGLFTFKGFLPDALSFEIGYNSQIPIGTSRFLKANGLFLLEPSMFSQFMALGLAIEIAALRRMRYIALMLLGLVVSLAGTGWIILASFVIAIAIGMKSRGLLLALATIALLGLGMAALAFVAPEFFGAFLDRIGEVSAPGSSGHARFVAPFWLLDDVVWRAPWSLWAGVGAGAEERMVGITYQQSPSTPIKLLIEYGLPTMFTYLALIVAGHRTRLQAVLLVPAMVLLLFTGSYSQMPPMLYPVLLVFCVPTLVPAARSATTRQ